MGQIILEILSDTETRAPLREWSSTLLADEQSGAHIL